MQKEIEEFCPDFYEWPVRWHGVKEDIPVGERILGCFEPFVADLIFSNLSDRTKKRHLDNLWILGGEIVRKISINDEYNQDIEQITKESVDDEGGPFCRHLHTDEEIRSFDTTCRKLAKHFRSPPGPIG